MTRWTCNDVCEVMNWPQYHCTSCHEDVDYGFDLEEINDGPDLIAACCAVAKLVDSEPGVVFAALRARSGK